MKDLLRRKLWPRSLRGQLVIGTTSVVCVVLMMLGGLTIWNLRQYVLNLADSQVAHSLASFSHSFDESRHRAASDSSRIEVAVAPPDKHLTAFVGHAPGTIIAVLHDGQVVDSAVFGDSGPRPAESDVVNSLQSLRWPSGPSTATLGDQGKYRVQQRDVGGGYRLVSAVSLTTALQAAGRQSVTIVVLVLIALVITGIGTSVVARFATRPLRRVADVASEVADLPLAHITEPIPMRVAPRDAAAGTTIGVVGRTLNALLDSVDAALAERDDSHRRTQQFLTDASHELRTPLASIQGYAELTRQDSAELPETTEYALARIESEARRMTSLVNDLLLLSRVNERQDLLDDDVDICDLVCDAVNDIAIIAPDHSWQTDLPDDPVWVRGDQASLHQLIAILLSNARTHTPAGSSVATRLRTTVANNKPVVEITLQDDGPGIPPELLPILFDRFVRQDKSRQHNPSSNGLGLAIAASIAEAHDSTLTVSTQPGHTVFTVTLPLQSPRH